ncbi:HNH endonuclease [Streptomyces sp. SRF1]|uniref:HNH endonuclease n=1 Tax=Streptomyces sp. SRF1 TaxID=1549642 RepID=UPI0025B010A2|nr:HNH endonuclease [Streptomyces sp. SRF1]MDN3057338.1 HNH endonuclease [Streptomyces sp. SRF1]
MIAQGEGAVPTGYPREVLADAVARSSTWTDLMLVLEGKVSGGRRRTLQKLVAAYAIDTSHFKRRSPWSKYSDDAIAEAVATSNTLREVVTALGARPATGTLSHIRRRIAAAGIDVGHIPGLNRTRLDLPFTREQLAEAAAAGNSVRAVARVLGVPDDGRTRAALGRMLRDHGVDTSHFSHARVVIPEAALRTAVANSASYADVMRALGLPVNDANRRRVHRQAVRSGIDTTHFKRRTRRTVQPVRHRSVADDVLRVLPPGSPRPNHSRLRAALDEVGLIYECAHCGNAGEWQGVTMTLQIDHVNGDWLDNRRENLRYLCPNCHAITDTWCRNRSDR